MIQLGDYTAGSTVRFFWPTFASSGASVTRATNGTLRIYKNTSTTERSSSNGITDTEDFDSLTGVHACSIDLSDNTDAGFYAAGNDYFVVLVGAVIDGQTVNVPLACFSIENRTVKLQGTTHTGAVIPTVSTLTGHTPQTGDTYARIGAPVGASISADIASVKSQTGAIETDTQDIQTRLPAALVGGRIDANVGAISADSTAADNAESFFDGTGYAGTNNVIPTVTTVGTVTNLTNAPTAGDLTATMKASVNAELDTALADVGLTTTVTGRVDASISSRLSAASYDAPSVAEIVDGLLDEAVAGTVSVREYLRRIGAVIAGRSTGTGTASEVFYEIGAGTATPVVTFGYDDDDNRTSVTYE